MADWYLALCPISPYQFSIHCTDAPILCSGRREEEDSTQLAPSVWNTRLEEMKTSRDSNVLTENNTRQNQKTNETNEEKKWSEWKRKKKPLTFKSRQNIYCRNSLKYLLILKTKQALQLESFSWKLILTPVRCTRVSIVDTSISLDGKYLQLVVVTSSSRASRLLVFHLSIVVRVNIICYDMIWLCCLCLSCCP